MIPFGVVREVASRHKPPPIVELLTLVEQHRLVIVRGLAPMGNEAFLTYCRSASSDGSDPCLHWEFGPIMELRPTPNAANYLFTREPVPFHWDGAFHKVPSVLVFNCIVPPPHAAGGETLFCDTTRVLATASHNEREQWRRLRLTYTTAKLAHYGGNVTVDLVARHPRTREATLRFAEPVATANNPVSVAAIGLPEAEAAAVLTKLAHRVYESDVCYVHDWQQGDLVFADNHALIHGRRPFTSDSDRHIRRIQLL